MENQVHNMKEIIDYAAANHGDSPAIRWKVKKEIITRTYKDLQADSQAFSRALEALGMVGSHVAIIGKTSYPWIISYFGTVNSQSVAVPVDAQLPKEQVWELLNRADVKLLVYDEVRRDVAEEAQKQVPGLQYLVSMQAEGKEGGTFSFSRLMEEYAGSYECRIDNDRMCAILFTSGTTGKSKGVMLSHRNLADNAACLDMGIPKGTVSMTLLPIHHAYCFTMDILKAVYIGMVICINDSIMHVQKNLKLFKPEIVLLVPMVIESIYAKLRDASPLIPKKMVAKAAFGGNLKTISSGGAFLNPDMVEAFAEYGITILQGYGMTECSPVISTNVAWDMRKGSVGKLLPNCQGRVVDEEIWVKGSSVMLGYYKMPKETAEVLEDGWLKTGDLGYFDGEGFLYLTGRKKNLIILSNGENVSPEELENEIGKDGLVKEILVRESENAIQAEIFPDMDFARKKHVRDIPAYLQALLDDYNKGKPVYRQIHKLHIREEEFEKTPSQKIKRQ